MAQVLDLPAESKRVHIEPADHRVPAISFSTDPDHVYGEYYDEDVDDNFEMEVWIAETACVVVESNNDGIAATIQRMDNMKVEK